MSPPTPLGPTSKLVKIFAKRNELEKQSTPTNVLGSPFVPRPRVFDFDDNGYPPFKRTMPENIKKSDTMRITPALLEASQRLARVMMEPDPEIPKLQESKLKRRQQKRDTKMAEDNDRFKGPFLKPFDEEVIKPHANTQNSAPNDHGRLEQVFWGEAIALRLQGRVDADGNEENQGISKHLMIPTKTTGEPASLTSSTVMPPPPRRLLMGSSTATGFKSNLQEDKPFMAFPPPAHAESLSSPVTGHLYATHLPRLPQKAMIAPPASYERLMGQTERRLSTTLSSGPNPEHIIYTHGSQPLFLPPEFVAADKTTPIQPAKKRRGHPTEDGAQLMVSDDDGKLKPPKKQRSVKLATASMGVSQGIKSTTARKTKISPLVPACDQDPKSSFENKTPHGHLPGQIPLPKLSPYVSTWDQVPESSSEKVFSTLSPYVSAWDQAPKSVSENEMLQEPFPGHITLPVEVESKPHDSCVKEADADTPAAAGGNAAHVLPGENVPTSAECTSSSTKAESKPSEDEWEVADLNAEETCVAGLETKN